MTFSDRAIEAAARAMMQHPDMMTWSIALELSEAALTAALAVDGLALVDQRDVAAGLVTVPISDLRTVIEIAGRNEASIEIECIKGYLADATAASDGEVG